MQASNIIKRMEMKELKRGDRELNEIRRLYEASFSEDEKMPFRVILNRLNEHHKLYLITDEEQIAGFVYMYLDKVSFVYYFAVEEHLRGKGYGTRILQMLNGIESTEKIVLEIDRVTDDMTEADESYRRLRFYEHSGYARTGICYRFFSVDYELIANPPGYTKEEYRKQAGKIWGMFSKMIRYE